MKSFPLTESMFALPRYQPPSAWTGHLPFAAWIMEKARPRVFAELGTHAGASYMGFCQAVHDLALGTQCYAIDTWAGDEHAGHYGEEVYATLKQQHDAVYAGFSRLIRSTFDDALGSFSDGSVDLLHIDGLHTYEAVRHDFESWLPKLSERGVVLFHDIAEREHGFGVWRLWEEVSSRYPSFAFTHAHGLGVLLVGDEVPSEIASIASGTDGEVWVRRMFASLGNLVVSEQQRAHFERLVVIRDQQLSEANAALAVVHAEAEASRISVSEARDELKQLKAEVEASRNEVVSLIASLDDVAANRNGIALERDAMADELAMMRTRQEQADSALSALDALCEAKAVALEAAHRELEAAREDIERVRLEKEQAMSSLAVATASLNERSEVVRQMEGSRSWRLTAPLRRFARLIGGTDGRT